MIFCSLMSFCFASYQTATNYLVFVLSGLLYAIWFKPIVIFYNGRNFYPMFMAFGLVGQLVSHVCTYLVNIINASSYFCTWPIS